MKDLLIESVTKKLSSTLEGLGGARAVYGDPITFGGEQIVPVARVSVALSAAADGAGSGTAGIANLTNRAKGGGGGSADASVSVVVEPIGFLRQSAEGPVFCPLAEKQ